MCYNCLPNYLIPSYFKRCAKSFAPFPTGKAKTQETTFERDRHMTYEIGLTSFEHPENNIKAMPMIDSEGVICGANFQVDACTKINAIPRRGTEANWALANTR
ncbi:unnamed protein product [Brassica oleracea var. botrytis]